MLSLRIHFRTVGILQAEHVAGKFNHHTLHTQTDTQCRHIMLATPFQGYELAFDTTLAKARSDNHTVHILQRFFNVSVVQLFRVDIFQIQFETVVCSSLEQRFVD